MKHITILFQKPTSNKNVSDKTTNQQRSKKDITCM